MTETAPDGADALRIEGLDVSYRVRGRARPVLRGLDLTIPRGGSYGLVGESGCGKSTAAMAAMRYLPRNGRIGAGRILIDGQDVARMPNATLRRLRERTVSMVYQDPGRALNPSIRVGRQVAEVYGIAGLGAEQAREKALAMLKRVRIADPASVMERYPHQLSGGMQQRVVIAMALALDRKLIVLDEPTTGLDATVEAEVLDLIEALRRDYSTAVLFIGHNLGVIARMCAQVGVLYAGRLVEEGPTRAVFADPRHPYTVGLLRCLPRRGTGRRAERLDTIPGFLPDAPDALTGCVFAPRCGLARDICGKEEPPLIDLGQGRASRCFFHEEAPRLPRNTRPQPPSLEARPQAQAALLDVVGLGKTFAAGGRRVHALRDISLAIAPGETLGLVGESGSGKSTLARILLGLTPPDAGSALTLDAAPLPPLGRRRRLDAVQMVFQNPDSALNRAHTVGRIIGRALRKLAGLKGTALTRRMLALTRGVQLADHYLAAKPRQLSGGLKQRVAIARAFAGKPRLIVCDEPTSALDVSVQAAILNLLADLQAEAGVSYLFISHDLAVVRYVADRIAVLYLGRLMEVGPADRVLGGPHHPYTEALLSAVPGHDGTTRRVRLEGEIPSALDPPSGCVFHTRCPRHIGPICDTEEPPLALRETGHAIRCHLGLDAMGREVAGPARAV
ncbi:MAG TPA: ABC transporter ATP-binding protein [Lichenihabitans sp.]|jgi:peptide/nickel transport system ATP-binding protein|nr:ABC transporter ATP-binding protein [Lichenihabitans sp.]